MDRIMQTDPDDAPRLAHDLQRLASRRRFLLAGSAGIAALGGWAASSPRSASATEGCAVIPEETAGPFPADGQARSFGRPPGAPRSDRPAPDALALSGIVRRDIRASLTGARHVAEGVPLALRLRLSTRSCAPGSLLAVYAWHCDREGRYSMYEPSVAAESHLRGVQYTDRHGQVDFVTVFPGCYPGRMPHVHFEVYRHGPRGLGGLVATSQLAFPVEVCEQVYRQAPGYGDSLAPLARMGFADDMVFADGVSGQMLKVQGDAASGYVARLSFAVAA